MKLRHSWLSVLVMALAAPSGFPAFSDDDTRPKSPPAPLSASELADRIDALIQVRQIAHGVGPAPVAGDAEFKSPLLNPGLKIKRKDFDSPRPKEAVEIDVDDLVKRLQPQSPGLSRAAVQPGSYYFDVNEYKPENLAASAARQFLGVRLECAQCHNHPFTSWSRKQFWEFAAFFVDAQPPQQVYRIRKFRGEKIELPDQAQLPQLIVPFKREMTIPGTDKVIQARFLDGQSPQWIDNVDSRQTLAEWITAPSNPYFARTGANRLWAHFFGSWIIDPVDDEATSDNPASHPELLAELADQFVAHKFDIKYLISAITASKTYQRSSAASDPMQNDPRLFARMAVKGLSPEQLFDNLALATGYQDPSGNQPGLIVPNTPRGDFLLLFATQDKKTETQTSILQALTLMNGFLVTNATSLATSPKLAALHSGATTNAERIETLYLITRSRFPRPEETSQMLRYVEGGSDPRAALADVYWALLNSTEFMFNH
jgi:hypothetical protein